MSNRFLGKSLKRSLSTFFRSMCLPVLTLTRTPSGGHCEWMAACCDPFFDYCERSVWIVGMVRRVVLDTIGDAAGAWAVVSIVP